ncbi:MAG: hypothetical protein ACE5GD_04070 [Candidatus Geothermarchaeales archaeon]
MGIDSIEIGDAKSGPITRSLQKKYEGVVRVRVEKYGEWLTYV